MSRRVYAETSVILSYMLKTAGRIETVDAALREAQEKKIELFTSVASIAEISYLTQNESTREPLAGDLAIIDGFWAAGPMTVVEINVSAAQLARDTFRDRAIRRANPAVPEARGHVIDAIHLGTALWLNVDEFWTYDEKCFGKYRESVGGRIRIAPPTTTQPTLGL